MTAELVVVDVVVAVAARARRERESTDDGDDGSRRHRRHRCPHVSRIRPSCTTVTASFPSRGEDRRRRRARAPSSPRSRAGRRAASRRHGTAGGTTSRGRGWPSARRGCPTPARTARTRGVEQRHVAGVGDDAGVQRRDRPAARRRRAATPAASSDEMVAGGRTDRGRCSARRSGAGGRTSSPRRSLYGSSSVWKSASDSGGRHVVGHRQLVVEPGLGIVEAGLQVEDRLAVLDRDDAPRGEAAAVADPIDLVEDRHQRVTRPEEVGVQRVHEPVAVVDRAGRGHQRLTGDLAAEHPLALLVGRARRGRG